MDGPYPQVIEDNADEGGEHLVVRGRAFSSSNDTGNTRGGDPHPQLYDQASYLDFLTGTD